MMILSNRFHGAAAAVCAALTLAACPVRAAVVIDVVTVGDAGNVNAVFGYGAVAQSFEIMTHETTNTQYAAFLNAVAATDSYSLYSASMGSDARGGITRSGASGNYTYAVKANMGDKPVNFVSWFDAARMANWLQNGQGSGSTETGAYTLVGGQTSGTAPARNTGATYYIPTQNQWYKAAYYKSSGTNAGYWLYPGQSDSAPTAVTSGSTGIGSAGSTGNFANFGNNADWNGQDGNVTTVGTNGGPSAYGLFDLGGNLQEWNDLAGTASSSRGLRGGSFLLSAAMIYAGSFSDSTTPSLEANDIGFRLVGVAVPEPST